MAERRSKIVLEAEAKGFDKAERAAGKMKDALDVGKVAKGYSDVQKHVAGLAGALQRASASAKAFDGSLDLKGKVRDAYGLVAAIKAIGDAAEEAEKKKSRLSPFTRGLAQGFGIGEYFPDEEKAGFRQNVAGRLTARGVSHVAGMGASTAGSVWTGSQGVLSGLAGIPVVGGALSGGMGAALGMSSEYLQLAQAQQGAGAYSALGEGFRPRGASKGARAPTGSSVADAILAGDDPWADPPNEWERRRDKQEEDAGRPYNTTAARRRRRARDEDFDRRTSGSVLSPPSSSSAAGGGGSDPLGYMASSGLDFGMNRIEALQFAQGIAQTSGGTLQSVDDTMFRKAAAAQSGFGIGGDVAGAFQRGDRLGAGGGGASGFEKQIERGLKLGLNGSDLQRYMRDTASALMQFEQNGMPLDVEALGATQGSMAAAFGANRGNAVASGFLQAGRGLAGSGAQSATQFQMLQDVYGYKGGGVDDYFDAVQRAEKGQAGDLGGFMKNLTVGGTSTKSKALILKSRLQQSLGVNIGTDEALRIADGDMTAFQGALDKAAKLTDGYSLESRGMGVVDGNVRRQKGQDNTRMATGGRMIGAAQDFEDASLKAAESMSNFDVAMKVFSAMIKEGATDVEKLFEIIGGFVNGVVADGKGR